MDLYNAERNRIKRFGQMQYEEAVASNERADAMRKQAAAQILAASEDEKQDVAEEQVQQIVTGAGASVSTAIDTAGVRTSLMKAAKDKGKEALKDAAKSRIKSVVEDSKLEQKAKEIKAAKGKGLISEAEELGKVGESKELADNVSRDRIIGRAFGKRAIGAMGTLANVSQGAYDLYKDTDGFTNSFHLEGANDLEKVSNALQLGSAAIDIFGAVTGQPEIIAIGMALGAASSVTGALGDEEEIEQKADKKRKDLEAKKDTIQASISKLKSVDPNKIKQDAMKSAMMQLGPPPQVASRVIQKVAA